MIQWLRAGMLTVGLGWLALAGCATPPTPQELARQVETTERAFAASMARRDHAAFVSHLAETTIFYGPDGKVLRGKAAVALAWKPFFDGHEAPFSWEPDQVDVIDDGTLAYSSGPVRNAQGQVVARFNSVWRREAGGVWRIVFDKGSPLSDKEKAALR